MIHAIWFILAGIIIGFLARLLLPGRDPIGIVGTIILGIVGALVGGYLWEALFGPNAGVSWIGSVIAAMVLLFIYRKMTYGRATTS
ncbi:MAG: hypothetical protein QOG21_2269 [Actinomycetota bacterium]|jgi:uncharacterized membrane protein YeaQ/YmgE (transglycosylase-associated protein family)|nr:hypothetical protein [Actinomycetota bacterium]